MLAGKVKLKSKIRKGDSVKVRTGRDRGKTGKVLRVDLRSWRAVVEGVNKIKRHTKPTATNPTGGIIEKESTIHLSNLTLVERAKG